MKFRKKPIVVEAERFDASEEQATRLALRSIPLHEGRDAPRRYYIKTREGHMTLAPGDWIITGVKGERYPCKPDIFEASYEQVET